MFKKINKDKKILIGIFGGLLLMLLAVGLYLFIPRQQEPVATEELVDCPLYWNVDREKYQPKLGGLSTRQPEADGFYTMRFLKRGEIVEYRVKDKELMLTIDSEDAMGLLVDEDGFVTEYVELIDMGVREVAKWYYVLRPKEDCATINTSTIGKGVNIDIKWQDDTGFWDVTNKEDYGCATKLELLDAVRVFNNADGKITDVFVVEREPSLAGLSPDQYCPHCDKVVTWTMWAFLDSIPSGEGHYWVVHDINTKKQYSMAKDVKQCINLNGKTITAAHEGRMISMHNEGTQLAIMDLSEEQTGTMIGKGDTGYGGIVWMRFGQFDLYGGTLDASAVETSYPGTAISVFNKDSVFNMHGGTIIGGTVKAKVDDKGKVSDAVAGTLAVKGTVNMYAGTIRDGKVETVKDKAGNKGAAAGGNIFVYANATFNMYDGLISGGTIVSNQGAFGGNIRVVTNATWNMYGGVIENGVSFNKAGNFSLFGTLNMSGGVIRGGKVMTDGESLKGAKVDADSPSKNLHMQSGEFNMTGGKIEGYVDVLNNNKKRCVIKISGAAQITGGKSNLTISEKDAITMGKLKKGAKIGISGGGFVTHETDESNRKYVFSDYGVDVLYEENRLLIGKYACICGGQSDKHFGKCDGTKLAWIPWPHDDSAPARNGNWYLLKDINLTKQHTLASNTLMNLDLNGFSISGEAGENGTRVYSLRNEKVKMQLTDLSEEKTGSIVTQGTGDKIGYGNCIWVAKDSELHMYGGCLDASKLDSQYGGTAVQVQTGCEFYMYDGSIKGGTAKGSGGAVAVSGVFEMYGGTISDGKTKDSAGNVYTAAGGKFKLFGGEVRNGEAVNYAGNVGGIGHIEIHGGVVADGKAAHGGNVWVKEKLTIKGGSIINGNATTGGNIFAPQDVKLTITGGTIKNGAAELQGGNIRVLAGAKTVIEKATICDGQAGNAGGNIFINGGTFTMESGKIIGGTVSDGLGANVYVIRQKMGNKEENATLNLNGGSIDGEIYLTKGNAHTLNLADDIQIGLAGADDSKPYGISWTGKVKINGKDVNKDANVVLATIGSMEVTGTGDERAFTILDEEVGKRNKIADDSNDDGIGKLSIAAKMCVCGATDGRFDHTESCKQPATAWQPWTGSYLPNVEGSYYLTENLTLTARSDIQNGAKVNLDLAGYTAEGPGWENNGLLYRVQKGTLNIADSSEAKTGTIKATNTNGANGLTLYVWGNKGTSVANIFGGTFTAEEATGNNGTTVSIHNGTINMYDGTIIPGTSTAGSNSVQVGVIPESLPTLNVKGGTIKGEVLLYSNNAKLSISDDAKVGIADGEKAYGIATASTVITPCTITCTDVAVQDSVVLKNLVNLDVTGTGEASAFTVLETASRNKIVDDKEDGIGNLSLAAYMCVCGAMDGEYDHTDGCKQPDYAWQPWTETTSLPITNGSYYLTQNLTDITTRSQIANGDVVNLDLAGYKVEGTGNGGTIYRIQLGTLNIADSSGEKTGSITMTGTTAGTGAVYVWGQKGDATYLNIFGGTFSAVAGNPVTLSRGYINMYDGIILPGTKVEQVISSTDTSLNFISANSVQVGMNTNVTAELNVVGGTIKGEVLIGNNSNTKLTISGEAKVGISDGDKSYGIGTTDKVTSVQNIVCNDITASSNIVLKSLDGVNVTGTGEASAFTVLEASRNTIIDDNPDGIGTLGYKAYMCVCGAKDGKYNHTEGCKQPATAWQPWTETTSLPVSGSYYLTQNLTGITTWSQIANGNVVNLDLAGYMVEGSGKSGTIYRIQRGTLNIADTSKDKTGAIAMTGTTAGVGPVYVWGQGGDATYLNIFGGTFSALVGNPVTVSRGEINMYGGTILPGTKDYTGLGFVFANSVQVGLNSTSIAKLNVVAGTIKGEVLIGNNTNASVTVSGDAKVGIADENQKDKAYGIGTTELITTTQTIAFSNAKGEVVLKDTNYLVLSGTGDASKFTIIDKHNKVVNTDANGTLGYEAYMCVCGKADGKYDHTTACPKTKPTSPWEPYNADISRTKNNSTVKLPATTGNYYLIGNMEGDNAPTTNSSLTNQNINFDLAGYTVDASDKTARLYILRGGKLNITDSVGKGVMKNAPENSANVCDGKVLWFHQQQSSAVNLFAGTLSAKGTSIENALDGSTVRLSIGTFNMFGGTIEGDGNASDAFVAIRKTGGTFNKSEEATIVE